MDTEEWSMEDMEDRRAPWDRKTHSFSGGETVSEPRWMFLQRDLEAAEEERTFLPLRIPGSDAVSGSSSLPGIGRRAAGRGASRCRGWAPDGWGRSCRCPPAGRKPGTGTGGCSSSTTTPGRLHGSTPETGNCCRPGNTGTREHTHSHTQFKPVFRLLFPLDCDSVLETGSYCSDSMIAYHTVIYSMCIICKKVLKVFEVCCRSGTTHSHTHTLSHTVWTRFQAVIPPWMWLSTGDTTWSICQLSSWSFVFVLLLVLWGLAALLLKGFLN